MAKSTLNYAMLAAAAMAIPAASKAIPAGYEDYGGVWLGDLNISPYVSAGWLYDSNPENANKAKKEYIRQNKDEDYDDYEKTHAYTIRPGVYIVYPGNNWKLEGVADYRMERYADDGTDDRDDWQETLTLSGKTEAGFGWNLGETYEQVDYEDQFDYSQHDRKGLRLRGGLSQDFEKSFIGLNGNYGQIDYKDEDLFDSETYGGSLRFGRRLTEKTHWTLTGEYSQGEQDDADSHTTSMRGMIGACTRSTEKLTFDAGAGIEWYEDFEDEEGNADDSTSFTYDLGAVWKATKRLNFTVMGSRRHKPSEDQRETSTETTSLSLTGNYRIADSWKLTCGVAYVNEDYTRKTVEDDGAWTDRNDDRILLSSRLLYGFSRFASIYGDVRYIDNSSNVDDNDYDRYRFSVGVTVRY